MGCFVKKNHKLNGFTLIELMIVVAILGTLAAIAVPRFAELMRKAKEGSTKGNLGVLRSCIKTYYAKNEGIYPTTMTDGIIPEYLEELPPARIGAYEHPERSGETSTDNDASLTDGWVYPDSSSSMFGNVWVNCTHPDTKGIIISSW
ncbi:MAG TPA: prepilin-type cleavage/methylation domain-containing protein [Elusimicrobia bacterium]|nr:prepilin-type cleavage/methylation domain-containing protein [Elusimicrobiota bacterium]